jgi:hypothetical protein
MIVISDTTPIIYFGKIGKLRFLKKLYSIIYIPEAVWEELIEPHSKTDKIVTTDIKYEIKAKEAGWFIIKNPESKEFKELALELSKEIGRGEAYAIALYLEKNADLLLINDKVAKDIAETKGINTKWNAEVLLEAFDKNYIKN